MYTQTDRQTDTHTLGTYLMSRLRGVSPFDLDSIKSLMVHSAVPKISAYRYNTTEY